MSGHASETADELVEGINLDIDEERAKVAAKASENAKSKNVRLRLLKARNENYLAERRDESDGEDKTKEL
jgi:hypothetical protein